MVPYYIALSWPDYQEYMEEKWFEEETYYDFNRDVYLIPIDRVHITKRIRKDMKSYTDIEQSKKLAEILPIESVDLYYYKYGLPHFIEGQGDYESIKTDKYHDYVPCWSLSALLNYLRKIDFFPNIKADEHSVTMNIDYYDEKEARPLAPVHSIKVKADNMIDVCYEIIIKLHEQNLL